MKTVVASEISADALREVLERPAVSGRADLQASVQRIIQQVRADGDSSLRALTRRYDGAQLSRLQFDRSDMQSAFEALPGPLRAALQRAADNIRNFHQPGVPRGYQLETIPGVRCEKVWRALDPVGLYIPAGTAPLPSTVLMLGIPAQLAGCENIIACCPPTLDGECNPGVLAAGYIAGVTLFVPVGGAQAVAAMAYGTESVPECKKIFGPGNAFVTEAKQQVSLDPRGAAIDMPAGPSEVMVLADGQANAAFVASDLLSQAEHGKDSQSVLICSDQGLASAVVDQIDKQMRELNRPEFLQESLANSVIVVVDNRDALVELAELYAPEHLILQVQQPEQLLPKISSAGSVFVGPYSPESVGDYCSGTNHVLPTYGYASAYSGVSVLSFMRSMSVQTLSQDGLTALAPTVLELAAAEGLDAHAQAVSIRMETQS